MPNRFKLVSGARALCALTLEQPSWIDSLEKKSWKDILAFLNGSDSLHANGTNGTKLVDNDEVLYRLLDFGQIGFMLLDVPTFFNKGNLHKRQ